MFSFRTFLRKTSPVLLLHYVTAQSRQCPNSGWDADPSDVPAAVTQWLQQLSRPQGEQVYSDFEQVHQLCDEVGQRALREVVGDNLEAFDALDGNEARGLSVLVSNPMGFRQAFSIASAERLYHGRSWSRYIAPQSQLPSRAPAALTAFEAEVKQLFKDFDGSGRKTEVECFERPDDTAPAIMYSIFVESPPQSMVEFDEFGPQRTTRRPVVEAVVCYGPQAGALDIVSKGGKRIRDAIGKAFVQHVLSSEEELLPAERRLFDLERLRCPMAFVTEPRDGISQVRVTALRLRDITRAASRLTIESTDPAEGVYAVADEWFGDANPLRQDHWLVEQARLQIVLKPERDGGRGSRVTIELRAPNGSNLKEQLRRHELISGTYLARWGLLDAERD